MESYKEQWFSEEPLDLSMKVNTRPKKPHPSNDSPLCMVKSCACTLAESENQDEADPSSDELSAVDVDKVKQGSDAADEQNILTTKRDWSGYLKKSPVPTSLYKRYSVPDIRNATTRSPVRDSPPMTGVSQNSFSKDVPLSTFPSTNSITYDIRQPLVPVLEREYSDVVYECESPNRRSLYYHNSPSPRGPFRQDYETSFIERNINKSLRHGNNRDVEKLTFVCMDTGKYYESSSSKFRGSGSKRVSSPVGSTDSVSQAADSYTADSAAKVEDEAREEHVRYSSQRNHLASLPSEEQSLSVTYATDATDESTYPKQTENGLWSPAAGLCYKQYLKRQFTSDVLEYDDNDSAPSAGKRHCDQADKNGCQNWLVDDDTNKNQQDRLNKANRTEINLVPKFEILPPSASSETLSSLLRRSHPYLISKTSVWDSDKEEGEQKEDNAEDDDEMKEKQGGQLEHTNRKMCALDYLISKVLVERIDIPFKACNTEINRIYRGECKGRLRLVDLIELQVEASLKV